VGECHGDERGEDQDQLDDTQGGEHDGARSKECRLDDQRREVKVQWRPKIQTSPARSSVLPDTKGEGKDTIDQRKDLKRGSVLHFYPMISFDRLSRRKVVRL